MLSALSGWIGPDFLTESILEHQLSAISLNQEAVSENIRIFYIQSMEQLVNVASLFCQSRIGSLAW